MGALQPGSTVQGGHAIALAVMYLILTMQVQVLSQDSPCEICVVQTGTETVFLLFLECCTQEMT